MPPSTPSKSPSPSSSGSKNPTHYVLIVLSLLIVAGIVAMYFKMDLLSKNLNSVAERTEQKAEAPTPTPQVTPPPVQTPPPQPQATSTEAYQDPTTGLVFVVLNEFGPDNYTFKKESVAGTELVSKISVKRVADGSIPACGSWFTISSAGGPIDPDAVLVTSKYMVSAPAADCEVIVKETSDWKTYTTGNFQFLYPNGLTPTGTSTDSDQIGIKFTDASNSTVFSILCPTPGTGFEAWDFAQLQRSYKKNGKAYNVELWLGTPVAGSKKIGNHNLIFMYEGKEMTATSSCMISSGDYPISSLYQRIYQSIK